MKTLVATLFVVALIAADPVLACGGGYSRGYVHRTTVPAAQNANAAQKVDKIATLPKVTDALTPSKSGRDELAKVASPVCKKYFPSVGEMVATPCSG
jgi:hypothetical protein